MVFHSNILHCIFLTFKRENEENSSFSNHYYYCQCFLSITALFANVFIPEDLHIGFTERPSG